MKRVIGLLTAWAISVTACGEVDPAMNPCGVSELETNDRPSRATSYSLGSELVGCVGARSDVHFYRVTAPNDRTGGYVQGSVTGIEGGTVGLTAYDGMGTIELARVVAESPGAGATFFLAVAPGGGYQLAVANEGQLAAPYSYKLATTYTPVPDPFEPNDIPEAAAPVAVGAATRAYAFAGSRAGMDDGSSYDDYFAFTAADGKATVTLDDVPKDLALRLYLYRADGMEVARVSAGLKGGVLMMQTPTPLIPGDHVLRVATWSGAPESAGRGPSLPDHFTRAYRLTINQP